MKHLNILLATLFFTSVACAQKDTLPPYLQVPYVPPFRIQLADSTWFAKSDLQKKPTLILYFSPECGHCQLETEEIVSRIKTLDKLQIVMITSRPYDEMKKFSDHYLLHRFPTIKMGSDAKRFITNFYSVKFTPFSALYDKKGKLVKVYEKGIDFDEMVSLNK